MTEHPYRGTVLVIPDPPPDYYTVENIAIGIIWLFNWFVLGVLWS